jgi:hypothetical protein
MALGRTFRFSVLNALGQTIASSGIVIKGRMWAFSSGVQTWGSESSIDSSAGTTANAAYFTGSTVDNSSTAYLGGTFKFTIVAPSSSSGDGHGLPPAVHRRRLDLARQRQRHGRQGVRHHHVGDVRRRDRTLTGGRDGPDRHAPPVVV